MKIYGLILAAGDSSRLGQAKQLVEYKQLPLIQLIENKLIDCCEQVYVVLGSRFQQIKACVNEAQVIHHPNWHLGMGSSIRVGIECIENDCDGVLLALCDQPMIESAHYHQLIQSHSASPEKIITTSFQQTTGVPAIFPACYFTALKRLPNERGAQALIHQNLEKSIQVECHAAAFDIDTEDNLANLLNT